PGAPLFDPGLSTSEIVHLDASRDRYLSFNAMILPSNDAFIGNDDPLAYEIFDESGAFAGPLTIRVSGEDVWDAGTEANTETDAAFFDQAMADAGEATSEGIALHPGFNGSVANPDGMPVNFLGGTNGAGIFFDPTAADFSTGGAPVAEIRISRAVDGSHSGTWFDPTQDGQGLVLEITEASDGNGARAVVSWYNYAADGSGDPVWLIGEGPVVGDTAIVDLLQGSGATFGDAFDPNDVSLTLWGQVRIAFTACDAATLSYESVIEGFGSGSHELSRLSRGPLDFSGACQP
ncbi:MAG: spondin domain-containing protein, partial [Pseudomonadota bacterium]